jgi:ectoine hydroxylase-related dioxygenase (phytanoyl-CoA dioxygenase family)
MPTAPTDTRCDTPWEQLSTGDRVRHLEVEGFVVLPRVLDEAQLAQLREELRVIKTTASDATPLKQIFNDIQWTGGALTNLIAHPPVIRFLQILMGPEIVMMTYDYSRSEPGAPGINLHADGQPWGSRIFGLEQSCPKLVRVLYSLEELTPDRAPFRVVPRSHLSFHADANPYLRYREHPNQLMVCCPAGSACLINQNVFHGNYPNRTNQARELLGIAYRPAWAGPCGEVPEWEPDELARVPTAVRRLMGSRNQRQWDYHATSTRPDLPANAAGINLDRWQLP